MANDRPKRRAIPVLVKRAVVERQGGICKCGCGQPVSWKPKTNTHFDHEPALRLRELSDAGDYIPGQHSQAHIDALCPASHHAKTHGTGATTAGTDTGKIKKERKRARGPRPKREIPPRPFPKSQRKLSSAPFSKTPRPFQKRKKT